MSDGQSRVLFNQRIGESDSYLRGRIDYVKGRGYYLSVNAWTETGLGTDTCWPFDQASAIIERATRFNRVYLNRLDPAPALVERLKAEALEAHERKHVKVKLPV